MRGAELNHERDRYAEKVPFCAGHRLLGHEGKCANLHGHNYVAEFYVTGKEIDHLGRVVDFQVINKLFKGWIDENWDHGFLLWQDDENAISALEQVQPNRIYQLSLQSDGPKIWLGIYSSKSHRS